MSLQTIIEIGHKIRNEFSKEESLQYHRFVKRAPEYSDKQPYSYYQIDVSDNYEIDFGSLREIFDMNIIKSQYYYLKYKTGEADNQVKYMFGDIAYPDFFKLGEPGNKSKSLQVNSFLRCKEDCSKISNEQLFNFRSSLEKNLNSVIQLFEEKEYCYLHFNFNGKSWYETNVFEVVETSMVKNFVKEENGFISLDTFITRTLAGSDKQERYVNFDLSNSYKSKLFGDLEEVIDLLYGLDFQQKSKINAGKDIMINMLPKGRISANGIITYFEKKSNYDYKNQKPEDLDPFAEPFDNPEIDGIEKYDIIFSKRSKPIGIDLLEITDIEQSLLSKVKQNIQNAKKKVNYGFTLDFAIKILFDEKKYTSHLLKILPLIYKDSYYSDDVLLPALIEKTEYDIRNGDGKKNYFGRLKQHFYFLTELQIKDTIMEIKQSKSYLLGTKLGIMSKPVSMCIKSFEKAYVGNLSRRIASLNDVVEFANYLNEKLMIHQKGYPSVKAASRELTALFDSFPNEEKYNRNYCALGFFETYYTYVKDESLVEEENITENK